MYRTVVLVVVCCILSLAFQDYLAALKITRENFNSNLSNYTTRELGDGERSFALPFMPSSSRPMFLAMSDAARAAVVRELGLSAKAFLMVPAFESAYTAKIKSQNNAVDYGLKIADSSANFDAAAKSGDYSGMQNKMEAMMRDQLRKMVLDQAKQISSFDGFAVSAMADGIKAQMESIPPKTAAEKAQHTKATLLLTEAMKLSATDVAAAREKYRAGSLLAVYVDAGSGDSAQVDEKKKEQQLNYNKRAFRPNLKLKLLAFVAEAKTVDFKAVTQPRGGKSVFVNPALEKKTPLWKLLYRLGSGGTAAAIGVAQTWAAEL